MDSAYYVSLAELWNRLAPALSHTYSYLINSTNNNMQSIPVDSVTVVVETEVIGDGKTPLGLESDIADEVMNSPAIAADDSNLLSGAPPSLKARGPVQFPTSGGVKGPKTTATSGGNVKK
ncbi:hypothetical protein HGRIS_011706 [Hohenbuehelia grisea]|uniref:Uncharacterized protein n=1 Tax=Hohenbuehelia grisea TaxID=104357 RepID=A0ABR3JY57_9AGAR